MRQARMTNVRSGAALLIVLFVVMAILTISLGFVSRSDRQLACGNNMVLRKQMDYLADAGLTHAKAFVAATEPVNQETILVQVDGTNDYYDVVIDPVLDPNSAPTGDYNITSQAYRMNGTEKFAQSTLVSLLYCDPVADLTYYKFIKRQ